MFDEDDEVFVGPVTLKEMKWHLTKPNYQYEGFDQSARRHTVHEITLPVSGNFLVEHESQEELDGSIILISSDDDEEPEVSLVVISDEGECRIESESAVGLEREQPSKKSGEIKPNLCDRVLQDSFSDNLELERSYDGIDQDLATKLSNTRISHDLKPTNEIKIPPIDKENFLTPLPKPKTKPKDRFDYIISSVSLYRKNKTPISAQKRSPNVPKFKTPLTPKFIRPNSQKSPYKDVVSPLALYIKGTTTPLVQNKVFKRVNAPPCTGHVDVSPKPCTSEADTTLPKVVYAPALRRVVAHEDKEVTLPGSVKKFVSHIPQVVRHQRKVTQRRSSLPDVSVLLREDEDLSLMANGGECSIVGVKNVFLK